MRCVAFLLVLVAIWAPLRAAADAYWGSFSSLGCVKPGYEQDWSRLWGINGDWATACYLTPATIKGVIYAGPNSCDNRGLGGEIGFFSPVPSLTCAPNWGSFKDDGCSRAGYRQYSSVLWNIPPNYDWTTWCKNWGATITGPTGIPFYFSRPNRCVVDLNMWGEFDVPDPCCSVSPDDAENGGIIHDELRRRRAKSEDVSSAVASVSDDIVSTGRSSRSRKLLASCSGSAWSTVTSAPSWVHSLRIGYYVLPLFASFVLQPIQLALNLRDGPSAATTGTFSFQSSGNSVVNLYTGPPANPSGELATLEGIQVPQIIPTDSRYISSTTGTVPAGGYTRIPLAPGGSRDTFIVTPMFTGCTLMIGTDGAYVYIAHIQPGGSGWTANRQSLAHGMLQLGAFAGVNLIGRPVILGGADDFTDGYGIGYGNGRAYAYGLATPTTVFFVIVVSNRTLMIDMGALARQV